MAGSCVVAGGGGLDGAVDEGAAPDAGGPVDGGGGDRVVDQGAAADLGPDGAAPGDFGSDRGAVDLGLDLGPDLGPGDLGPVDLGPGDLDASDLGPDLGPGDLGLGDPDAARDLNIAPMMPLPASRFPGPH